MDLLNMKSDDEPSSTSVSRAVSKISICYTHIHQTQLLRSSHLAYLNLTDDELYNAFDYVREHRAC